jgi:hypothetical protein
MVLHSTLQKMTIPSQINPRLGNGLLTPALPTELWLQILEQTDRHDASHLWSTVRLVSKPFKEYVERHFISVYLPDITISLALPRRDPATGALKWPGDPIPRARIIFSFDGTTSDQQNIILKSSKSLGPPGETKSVAELRRAGGLPEERLREAPPWLNIGKNALAGVSVAVNGTFCWDDGRKIWTWEVDWRKLVTHFYRAKMLKRELTSTENHRIGR